MLNNVWVLQLQKLRQRRCYPVRWLASRRQLLTRKLSGNHLEIRRLSGRQLKRKRQSGLAKRLLEKERLKLRKRKKCRKQQADSCLERLKACDERNLLEKQQLELEFSRQDNPEF